ncbi:MAG: hypothetical protein D6748_04385 [Calditrichaeota bacterium]|nr:MAG: hypothetical protein D6748_04385 [Calditrichota bacterium]
MLLPKGIEKHKNLNTSFTKFEQLLQDLAENRFSGYMILTFWGYEGILVLDTGHIIEASSTTDEVKLNGERAVLQILAKAEDPDGVIEVYELPSEVALALGYAMQASLEKSQFEMSNYTLGQVFDMLENQSMTGFVDLEFSANKGFGTVFYLEGTPVEAVIMSNSGKIISGEQVYMKFLEIGEMIQPRVTVYSVNDPKPLVEEQTFLIPWQHDKFLAFWNELLQYLHTLISDQSKKQKFLENFRKICSSISDHYPFLHPETGRVKWDYETFRVERILPLRIFLQGMSLALNRLVHQVPSRRLRKLSLSQITQEVGDIAQKYDISNNQLEPQKFVYQIFRGLL